MRRIKRRPRNYKYIVFYNTGNANGMVEITCNYEVNKYEQVTEFITTIQDTYKHENVMITNYKLLRKW